MSNENYVVVFPSIFAENKISLLVKNIKKILKIHNQKYEFEKQEYENMKKYLEMEI